MSVKGREGFPGGSDSNEFVCNAEDLVLIPRLGRSSGEGNGKPNQYFSLENAMDGGAWGCQRVRHNLVLNNKIYDFYYAY